MAIGAGRITFAVLPAILFATPPTSASAPVSHIPAACPASQTTPPSAENKFSSSWLNDCFAPSVLPSASAALPPDSALGAWLRHPVTNGAACPDAAPIYPTADRHPAGHP